jgi:hypothetical protein
MKQPSEVYESLLTQLAAGELSDLQRRVYNLLRDHPDGLTRYDLVEQIFGYRPVTVDGNIDDRKIRKAIEKLRTRLFPIISTSGKPGYRLDVSRDAAEKMLAELLSRKKHLEEQADAVSQFFKLPMPPTQYKPARRMRVKRTDSNVQQLEMSL